MSVDDFERRYLAEGDPFGVHTRWYERRKQAVLLASLTRERYASAWEAACGTGALTAALAARCDSLTATDASPAAVRLTRTHVGADVTVLDHRLPDPAPCRAELVVLAEVLYYLPAEARTRAVAEAVAAGATEIAAVHWRHRAHDTHLSGEDVQAETGADLTGRGWRTRVHHVEDNFVLDVWTR